MMRMTDKSKKFWLLKGARDEAGWAPLESDARSEKIDVVIFDRGEGWALVFAENAPVGYEGMKAVVPKDGLYVSENGYPVYIVDCQEVPNGKSIIKAIGPNAEKMLDDLGDPESVLQKLGYVY